MTLSPGPSDTIPISPISSTVSASALNTLSREQYEIAARALEKTWTRSIYAVGAWHALTLCLMNNFAIMLIKLGRHGEAQLLLQKAVAEMELRLPARHPEYYFALCSLATLCYIQGHEARGDSTIAKCEAYADNSIPSTLRSCLDAAYLARSIQKDTLKFKDLSRLAYTQEVFDESQLSVESLDPQHRESRPALIRFLSLSNLREPGARITEQNSHGKWRQWIPMRRKNLAYSWTVLPESPEYTSNAKKHISRSKKHISRSKKRMVVRWADRVSSDEETSRISESRRSSMIVEIGNRIEFPLRPAALELPTNHHICLADRIDQEEQALRPIPDLPLVVELPTTTKHRSTLADNVATAGIVPPLLSSNQSSKPGGNELEIEGRSLTSRPCDSKGSTALGQWANIVLESCIIKEELEDHWLEVQPLSDRVQLSTANLERGSLEFRTSLSKVTVLEPNTIYATSVSSSTPIRSPESFHGAAAELIRDESTISPVSSAEDRAGANSHSNPSADSSNTGSTELDVVSAEYCKCWGHPVLEAPERLQNSYLAAMGCPVTVQGIAKICLRWRGQSGTKTIAREFAVVEDFPVDMLFGNRTITRFDLLRESAGLLLPLLLAPRSKKDKARDREQTREAKVIAKKEEVQHLKERLKRWSATPDSPFGSTSSSDLTTSSETASRATTTRHSGGQFQESSQGTSLMSDFI
ncbi:MAG: hypothetical protein Q9160_003619 [Pyrenula sp. 1 TL-2023]